MEKILGNHTSVNIHGYVCQVELNQRIVDALQISTLGIGTFSDIEIGDEIGKAIGLY